MPSSNVSFARRRSADSIAFFGFFLRFSVTLYTLFCAVSITTLRRGGLLERERRPLFAIVRRATVICHGPTVGRDLR